MKIVVIDGQGGKLGSALVKELLTLFDESQIYAIGTNSLATSAMIKAGAKLVATGENAVKVNVNFADVIVGPIGIAIPNALMGEVTPKIAEYVSLSNAKRVLIPTDKCNNIIVGAEGKSMANLIQLAVLRIKELTANL